MKTTIITNVITRKKSMYVNNLSLKENVINEIIGILNCNGQLTNKAFRQKIENSYEILEGTSSITGNTFASCIDFDLHAKTEL